VKADSHPGRRVGHAVQSAQGFVLSLAMDFLAYTVKGGRVCDPVGHAA
jgi:hypothetical protein